MASTSNDSAAPKRALKDVNAESSVAKKAKSSTKSITKKELNEKLRYSQKSELTALLKTIFQEHLSPTTCYEILEFYTPDNAPLQPLADDPLLKECFHCHATDDLSEFHAVKICTNCNKSSLNRDEVMSMFDFTKPQADKIKRTNGYGMYGGVKYIYSMETVVRAVKKRDGSLFNFVARSTRSPPTTGELLKAASTAAKKKKVINDALKYSDESSLKLLLTQTIDAAPELKQVGGVLSSFVPSKMPMKPSANDPLLQQCFICHSSDNLKPFYDISVCNCCDPTSGKHGGTLTRDKVMSYFHFSKTEADKISRKKTTGGMYRSLIYVYNIKTVVNAAKKKHGSLYNMVKTHTPSYLWSQK